MCSTSCSLAHGRDHGSFDKASAIGKAEKKQSKARLTTSRPAPRQQVGNVPRRRLQSPGRERFDRPSSRRASARTLRFFFSSSFTVGRPDRRGGRHKNGRHISPIFGTDLRHDCCICSIVVDAEYATKFFHRHRVQPRRIVVGDGLELRFLTGCPRLPRRASGPPAKDGAARKTQIFAGLPQSQGTLTAPGPYWPHPRSPLHHHFEIPRHKVERSM